MKLIPLKGKYGEGKFTKVSDEDFEFASSLSLYVNEGYAKTYYKGRYWKLHQLLVGSNYDHINRDRLDNTRENLRPATQGQQNINRIYKNKSGFRGVRLKPDGAAAEIWVRGKTVHLGTFDDPHHAALVRDLWAVDLYGEYAYTNFPAISC